VAAAKREPDRAKHQEKRPGWVIKEMSTRSVHLYNDAMKPATVVIVVLCLCATALGQAPSCVPATPPEFQAAARGGQAEAQPRIPVPRDVTIMEIPGVVASGVKWTKIWQQGGNSADGIIPDKDGSVLVAQEDYDAVLKIDPNGKASVFVANAKGVGSVSMDRQGRLYGLHRTERPGSTKPDRAMIINAITILAPERKTVADKWADGTPLTVRPNDLLPDGQGGAYFTSGCLYYANPKGGVTVVADNIRTNGIAFSPDDKTLYVTNGGGGAGQPGTIVAFDVKGPGVLANRREFAKLEAGGAGDGCAVDAQGRLYVTSNPGVQVFDRDGKYLGVIPTPRGVISVAFAGPGKKTLFVVGSGAEDSKGEPIREGPQQTAATIYKLPMIAEGIKGRAK
jgi:gluconolactonase